MSLTSLNEFVPSILDLSAHMTHTLSKLHSFLFLSVLALGSATVLGIAGCGGDLPVSEEAEQKSEELEIVGDPPKLIIEESEHNFGSMEVGQTLEHEFVIRNEGEGVLKLKKDRSTCKCTMAEFEEVDVEPGDSYKVKLSWIAKALDPAFSQAAYIKTNDPDNKEIELRVVGRVDETFDVSPTGVWALGSMDREGETKFSGTISSRVLEDFEVTGHKVDNEFVEVNYEKMSDEELAETGAKIGYKINGSVKPGSPLGRFHEYVEVNVKIDGEEEEKVAPFEIEGYYAGPMQIVGPAGWVASDMLLMLGRFSADKGKEVTLSIFLRDNEGEPLQIESLEADPDIFEISLVQDKNFEGKNRERYELTIAVPPGSPSVVHEKYDPATISIKTNSPLVNEMFIRVVMVTY